MSFASHCRRTLMLGAAGSALALMLIAVPVAAQTSDQVTGTRVLANHQRSAQPSIADTSATTVSAEPLSVDGSSVRVDGNQVAATARTNRTMLDLAIDSVLAANRPAASLISGRSSVIADGNALIASTQRADGASVSARNLDSMIRINAGATIAADLGVTDNASEARATGNDGTARLSLDQLGTTGGAAILGFQSNDSRSTVSAGDTTAIHLVAGETQAGNLALAGNSIGAIAHGNIFTSSLVGAVGEVVAAPDGMLPSYVPGAAQGNPGVAATFATLTHQEQDATVGARAGYDQTFSSLHLIVDGSLIRSSTRHDLETLIAGGYGNRSSNGVDLTVGTVTGRGGVVDLTNVQRTTSPTITADTLGGFRINVLGDATGSSLSLSNNLSRSNAFANAADGNLVSVEATSIDTIGNPWDVPIGTAKVGADNGISVSAPFSLQNVQDFGETRVTARTTSAIKLGVLHAIGGSRLAVDGNDVGGAATGNSATNGLTLTGAMLRTSADLNNVQSGDGGVRVEAGFRDTPLGSVIALNDMVQASQLSVAGNRNGATSFGNAAANSIAIAGADVANGSGHDAAIAGPLDGGYGAAADFALASHQKLGMADATDEYAGVSANSAGRFGTIGTAPLSQSRLIVTGNSSDATAVGNTVGNRLTVTGAMLGSDSAEPGSALSSAQYGDVVIKSRSHMMLGAPVTLDGSSIAITGNANRAYGGINEADNRLSVSAVDIGSLASGVTRAAIGSSPSITGDHILANIQFATNRIQTIATTTVGTGGGQVLNGSTLRVADNVTTAEAAANRAVNSVALTAASGAGASAGIASMQVNAAGLGVTAALNLGSPTAPSAQRIDASSVSIADNMTSAIARGNAADNRLTVAGRSAFASPAMIDAGRYDAAVEAGAPLLNAQTNYGAINATATMTLNGIAAPASVSGSTIEIRGNTLSAAGYGNVAANTVALSTLGTAPSSAVANVQTNYGAVTAIATGLAPTAPLGAVTGSPIGMTGNQVSAFAAGNQATNTITATH